MKKDELAWHKYCEWKLGASFKIFYKVYKMAI
jgi:hypothetical protein